MEKNYTLALDIGTTSVGWCVVDENNQIPQYNNKNLWGTRLFESAQTAEATRNFRGARRRYLRRRRRLELLQLLFQEEIKKIDDTFFDIDVSHQKWLKNKPVEKNGKMYANFENKSLGEVLKDIGDKEQKYKNMYFLQDDIIKNGKNKKFDLRLIYLAVYSNVKYRGHFLNEFSFKDYKPAYNIESSILEFLELEELNSIDKIVETLKTKNNLSKKKSDLKSLVQDKITLERLYYLMGSKTDVKKLFVNFEQSIKVCLRDSDPLSEIIIDEDKLEILTKGYNIYMDLLVNKVLSGEKNICSAQVNAYNEFNKDLKDFRTIIKKYRPADFKLFMKKNGVFDNYLYGKNHKSNDCNLSKDQAYVKIGKLLDKIKNNDDKVLNNLKKKYADGELFLKQRSNINASTPHQLKAKDVYDILDVQKEYYSFIDDEFINKVVQLITYRIPYFVGPLIKNEGDSRFGWLVRKSQDRITPWNIDDVIDKGKTAELFIERMVKRCSELYNVDSNIIDNMAMSKESLTYQLFTVYNELNGVRIIRDGAKPRLLTKDEKNTIVEKCFKKRKTVSTKHAIDSLEYNGDVDLIGTQSDSEFSSTLSTYISFSKFVDNPLDYTDEIDDMIKILNVFTDKEIIARQLSEFKDFEKHVDKIKGIKVSGWGRLCKYLLKELQSDGKSIIDYLIDGSEKEVINFRKLITSDDYTFKKQIEDLNASNNEDKNFKNLCEEVSNLTGSPATKRGVLETVKIVNELIVDHNINITRIAIEFAGGDEEKSRTDSFEKKFSEMSKNSEEHKKLCLELKNEEIDYSDTKIRLYLLQQGKCLYSGEQLGFDRLDECEIDHIRPRSLTKDNSINNLALVKVSSNQRKNDGETVLEFIPEQKKTQMIMFWESLFKSGAISQLKLQRLMKKKNSEEELEMFMQRTLVETRQIGKHVKELLTSYYGDGICIYNVSSDFTSRFRNRLKRPKVRKLSVKHHCEDAYMLGTITNYTLATYGEDFFELGKGNTKLWYVNKNNLLGSKNKAHVIINGMTKKDTIINNEKITNPIEYYINEMNKEFLLTKKVSYQKNDAFWEQTNYSPHEKKDKHGKILGNERLIRSEFKTSYLLLVEYDKKDRKRKCYKRERKLVTVPIIVDKYAEHKTYYDVACYLLPDKKNISIIKKIDVGSIIESKSRFTITSSDEKASLSEFEIPQKVYAAFDEILNSKTLSDFSKKEIEQKFCMIIEFIENNFDSVYGKNIFDINHNFMKEILDVDIEKFEKDFKDTVVGSITSSTISEILKIDLVLEDSQVALLNLKDGDNEQEIINKIATVYSCGKKEVKEYAEELMIKGKNKILDYIYKESVKKAVNELVNALAIGSGRSQKFKFGRIETKIDIFDTRLIHQSPTGLVEIKTEFLNEIKKDKNLRKG